MVSVIAGKPWLTCSRKGVGGRLHCKCRWSHERRPRRIVTERQAAQGLTVRRAVVAVVKRQELREEAMPVVRCAAMAGTGGDCWRGEVGRGHRGLTYGG
jgi:hypothetical protein